MEFNCRFKEDTYGIMTASTSFVPESAIFGVKELLTLFPTLMEVLDS